MIQINSFAAALGSIIACATLCPASVSVKLDLTADTLTSTEATFDVALAFSGDPTDQIESFQLSVIGSDPLLTNNDTDFRRFSFALNAATAPLNTWISTGTLHQFGLELGVAGNPIAGPFITPSATPISLGTLSVDLTGLSANTDLFVTLSGGTPGVDSSDVGGAFGGIPVFSVAGAGDPNLALIHAKPAGIVFQTPSSGGGAVPEPAGLMIWTLVTLIGGACFAYNKRRTAVG